MTLNRISTPNQVGGALANLMRAQQRQAEAQQQVGSEKRAVDLKGYGREAETLTALRSVQAKAESFVAGGQAAGARLAAQNLSLEHVADAADGARRIIAEAVANGRAEGLMIELETRFQAAVSGLNGKHQGRHLFAGASVERAPVTADSLAELAAAPATADVFVNDGRAATARLDEATTVKTGFLADEVGGPLFEVFRRIKQFADGPGGPLQGPLTAAQSSYLEGELAALADAHTGLIGVVARNGGLQNQVEEVVAFQRAQADHTEVLLADRTGVDLAEAISRLQLAQTTVQASAQVLAALRSSSLLELLR